MADYLDRLYYATDTTRIRPKNNVEKKNYSYRCYCTQVFRYYDELKRHRKEANHPAKSLDVPKKI